MHGIINTQVHPIELAYQKQITDEDFIKIKTRTRRPCGDENFYEEIKVKFGKELKPKRVGRPNLAKPK